MRSPSSVPYVHIRGIVTRERQSCPGGENCELVERTVSWWRELRAGGENCELVEKTVNWWKKVLILPVPIQQMEVDNTTAGSPCIELLEGRRRSWWTNLLTSVVIYLVCICLSSLYLSIKFLTLYCQKKTQQRNSISNGNNNDQSNPILKFKKGFRDFFRLVLLGDSIYSQVLITVNLACNVIFLGLAMHRASHPIDAEIAFSLKQKPQFIIEFIVNLELLMYALIRLCASSNIVTYWFSPYTIVDVLTLPHIIVSVVLGVDWIGLRSLRFIWLTEAITVLQFIPYISRTVTDVWSLLINVLVLWLTSTGIFHLLESQGDPWNNFENAQCESFFLYAYTIMVTLSTVGYGDVSPKTTLGYIFITFFIIGGLALFAAMLPKLAEITSAYYESTMYTSFDTSRVPRHVIVCGHITDTSVGDFFKDFLHPDRGDKKTHILVLHHGKPDVKLRSVLTTYYTRVQYLDGSVLNSSDLTKAKIKSAHAVFILANKNAPDPTEEDHANLFRLVSVKNTTTDVPVIIQLLHSFSRNQVHNIDGWNKLQDVAISLNEMTLGLLAQSCICPGFSTLIANLFYASNFPAIPSKQRDDDTVWYDELYIKGASNEIYTSYFSKFFFGKNFHEAACFCFKKFELMLLAIEENGRVFVNPSETRRPNLVIGEDIIGYFVAQNRRQVWIVESFSLERSVSSRLRQSIRRGISRHTISVIDEEAPLEIGSHRKRGMVKKKMVKQRSAVRLRTPSVDSVLTHFSETTEKFHICSCEPYQLKQAVLNSDFAFTDVHKARPEVDIKDHIVVCIFSSDKSPLMGLHSFLNPLRNKLLSPRSVKPVVIISNQSFIEKEWMLIRSIPNVNVVVGSPLRWANLQAAKISNASVCVVLTAPSGSAVSELGIIDKEPILCTLSLKQAKKLQKCRTDLQIITDLILDSSVQFLDIGDEDKPDEKIYETHLFASGEAFSASMFDSVTSSAFHSPGIVQLLESLIYPSKTSLLKAVPIAGTEFSDKTFFEFYKSQIEAKNMCLGLFRKIYETSPQRFVITAPDPKLKLKESDIAYVITE